MASRLTTFVSSFALLVVAACAPGDAVETRVEMRVAGVRVDPATSAHVLLLEEPVGAKRKLPIWIGPHEARSIALRLEEVEMPRPNTHDLIKNVLSGLGVTLERVVVTELRSGTYFAVIELDSPSGSITIDSRPSDAIAIAVRTETPILATDSVLKQAVREGSDEAFDVHWRPGDSPDDTSKPTRGQVPDALAKLLRVAQKPGPSAQ